MKITITGMPCSGKSYIGKRLAEHFGLEFVSMGLIMRVFAKKNNRSFEEQLKLCEQNDYDKEFDDYQKELVDDKKKIIIDSRLGALWFSDAIKVFLDVTFKEAAKRLLNDPERASKGEDYSELKDAENSLRTRVESDQKRYLRHYNHDIFDKSNYDIVLDTTNLTRNQVFEELVKKIKLLITE